MILGTNIASDPRSAPADCGLAQILGAKWIRVSIEQSNPNAIADLTAIVAAAHAHGLLVLQTCQPIGHVQPKTQLQIDTYSTFVAACSTIADATGRDNENNGYGSNETPDPKTSADSMISVIETRDKHARGRLLVTDELCPAAGEVGSSYVEPLTFFKAMIAAQPKILQAPHLWLGWHGYCDFRYHADEEPYTWDTCWMQRELDTFVRSVNNGSGRPIVSSEFGASTAPAAFAQCVSPAAQADDFDAYMRERRSQHKAGVAHGAAPWIWYTLRDRTPANSSDWPAGCGLVDLHGESKPIASRFSAAARVASES